MGLNIGAATDPVVARDVAQAAEALGYDSLWVGDHPVLPNPPRPGSPFPPGQRFGAPLLTLAALAPVTSSIRLATGVLLLPQRQPVHLAKERATLDRLSHGRLVVGIGAGYLDVEFAAVGASLSTRGARIEESIAAIRELWTADTPEFAGSDFVVSGVECLPRPVQPGGPPWVVGGQTDAAFDRAARIGDGWLGWFLDPAQLGRRVARLHARPRPAGAAPLEISLMPSVRLDADVVAEYATNGVDRLVVTPGATLDGEGIMRFVARNAPAALGLDPTDTSTHRP